MRPQSPKMNGSKQPFIVKCYIQYWLYVVFSEDTHLFVQSPYSIYIVLLRYMEQHTFKHLMLCTVYLSLLWSC